MNYELRHQMQRRMNHLWTQSICRHVLAVDKIFQILTKQDPCFFFFPTRLEDDV